MRDLLTTLQQLGGKPVETLTVEAARQNPSIADAVRAEAATEQFPLPPPSVAIRDTTVPGAAGPIPARVYTPGGNGPKPVILYFHGGGWVVGTLESYDASARGLAGGAGAIVVSVGYRQGPENRFPAAHDDANAAYRWLLANARSLGGDPRKIAVAGEGAGANLAFNVSATARDARLPMPVHELLVYPIASTDPALPSAIEDVQARPLSTAGVNWYLQNYLRTPADLHDSRIDLVGAATAPGLPVTTIVLAGIDPLRSGGQLLAEKLTGANVPTRVELYPLVTHDFFGTGAVVHPAQAAMTFATDRLKKTFNDPPALPRRGTAPARRAGRRR